MDKTSSVTTLDSSSGPCVLGFWTEQNQPLFTTHFRLAAKVIHRRLRRSHLWLSSPTVNNFGVTIRRWRDRYAALNFRKVVWRPC